MVRVLYAAAMLFGGLCASCMGRYEDTGTTRTLPFHAHEDELAGYAFADLDAPPRIQVEAEVTVVPFVAYYPEPAGMVIGKRPKGTTRWTTLGLVGPELSLGPALAGSIVSRAGPRLTVNGVVTRFEWYVFEGRFNAGQIVSSLVVTNEAGAVLFAGSHRTRARARLLDALVAAHVADWLRDPRLLAALDGGAP